MRNSKPGKIYSGVSDTMSRAKRNDGTPHLGSLGVTSAIFLCSFIVGLMGYLQGQHSERDEQSTKAYTTTAKEYAKRACVQMEERAAFECIVDVVESSKEQSNADQDLTAQYRAANSALLGTAFIAVTLFVSGLGVWYVKRTLDATLEAVKDNSEATEVMRKANILAMEANRPWMRVWLEITEPLKWKRVTNPGQLSTNFIGYKVNFENVGVRPAVSVKVIHEISTSEDCTFLGIEEKLNRLMENCSSDLGDGRGGFPIFPNGKGSAGSNNASIPQIIRPVEIYIIGFVSYMSHGVVHKTPFIRQVTPAVQGAGLGWAAFFTLLDTEIPIADLALRKPVWDTTQPD